MGCSGTPSSFTSFPFHCQIDEVSQEVSAEDSGADRHRGACPSFARFLHHFTGSGGLGGVTLSSSSSDGGDGGGLVGMMCAR